MQLAQTIELLSQEFSTSLVPETIQIIIFLSPVALMLLLGYHFWYLWRRYIRARFYNSLKYAVLEIKLPKETTKSPLAMEAVLTGVHNTSESGWVNIFWKGEYRPYFSLEVASKEGRVSFYIWVEDRRKGGIMSALYAQYPGIEIIDGPDYTQGVVYDPKVMKLWAAEFIFTKPDPYPIKTYIDFGLEKDPKEEYKVDPMLYMIEFLNSVPVNQQIWFQFICRAHRKEQRKPGHLIEKYDAWEHEGRDLINKLMMRDPKTKKEVVDEDVNKAKGLIMVSKGEEETMKAIERSLTKLPFDVGIRCIYMAPRDEFNTPFGIGGCISSMKQFNSNELNGFKPNGKKWIVQLDEPWKDYKDARRNRLSVRALQAYKRRSYFYPPFESTPLVLNTEELATIYHFPGSVAASPGLDRIPSKKAEAPGNLPI